MSIADQILGHDRDAIAVVESGNQYTYGDLLDRVGDIRAFLIADGVRPGDRVSIAAASEYAFVVGLFAIIGVGAIAVPTNPLSPIPELHRMLKPLEPKVILAGPMAHGMAAASADAPAQVVSLDDIGPIPPSEHPPVVPVTDDDIALLMMTSGTSGPPKAAMLSHGNVNWTLTAMTNAGRTGLKADDAIFSALPTAHIFGLMIVTATMIRGGTAILQPRFDPSRALDLIAEHQVSFVPGAPLMWRRWANAPGSDDRMRSVTRALSGAASLPLEVYHAVLERFGVEIHEGYGLTETSALVSSSIGITTKATSVGRPLGGMDVRLVEDSGAPVERGDTGEIVVRGPGVFQGYWNDQAATEEVLTEDGWLWTGDVGAIDDDGYLYIVDRMKDVIIVSGFNVYPAEVEDVLVEHPGVDGAVVVGTTDPERGEAVVAYVTGSATTSELHQHAAEHLASYKRPSEIRIVDNLPQTPTGKMLRRELR